MCSLCYCNSFQAIIAISIEDLELNFPVNHTHFGTLAFIEDSSTLCIFTPLGWLSIQV